MADTATAIQAATATLASSPGRSLKIPFPAGLWSWLDGGLVTVNVGFDLALESAHLAAAAQQHRPLLSIRLGPDEALIGPFWCPDRRAACAGCAEIRLRGAVDHPLRTRDDVNASPRAGWPAALSVLIEVGLDHLGPHPLAPGEMLRVGLTETRRHRVARSAECPMCAPPPRNPGPTPPGRLALQSCPSLEAVPLRGGPSPAIAGEALPRLVDYRVGPVIQVMRDDKAPFAMSGALVPGARAMGYGRGANFGRAGQVAILEAYERLGAVPHQGQIIQDLPFAEVRPMAVDPMSLGRYSPAQLAHPNSRVMAYGPEIPMDWAYAHRLDDGEPWLVPADVAFYGYEYRRRPHGGPQNRFFAESSSGCALGSGLEEAALHALMELIERDSFLMAWCRRVPLPVICRDRSRGRGSGSGHDPISRMLLDGIETRGFDIHLLATTFDLGLPSIWALAVNRDPHAVPATFSAAGSSPVPGEAVRAALWELAQLVARPVDWDVDGVRPMLDDPTLVDTIEDHVRLYAMPERRDRVTEVLGGPTVTMDEAFPGWPQQLVAEAQGDVRGALDHLLSRCRAAGLEDVLVVDQSTREHRDLGLRVARVIVPGILPMCFGAPQQRLGGLARRQRALLQLGRPDPDGDTAIFLDPHPFP